MDYPPNYQQNMRGPEYMPHRGGYPRHTGEPRPRQRKGMVVAALVLLFVLVAGVLGALYNTAYGRAFVIERYIRRGDYYKAYSLAREDSSSQKIAALGSYAHLLRELNISTYPPTRKSDHPLYDPDYSIAASYEKCTGYLQELSGAGILLPEDFRAQLQIIQNTHSTFEAARTMQLGETATTVDNLLAAYRQMLSIYRGDPFVIADALATLQKSADALAGYCDTLAQFTGEVVRLAPYEEGGSYANVATRMIAADLLRLQESAAFLEIQLNLQLAYGADGQAPYTLPKERMNYAEWDAHMHWPSELESLQGVLVTYTDYQLLHKDFFVPLMEALGLD